MTAIREEPLPATPEVETKETDTILGPPEATPSSILIEDWSGLRDEGLAQKFTAADQMQGVAFILKCKAVSTFRQNHVQIWGESWTEQATELFGISRRTCFAYANIWEISAVRGTGLDLDQVAPLTDSRSLMSWIGQKAVEDGALAMEAAVAHFAEYGEPPTVADLAHKLGEEQPGRSKMRRWSADELREEAAVFFTVEAEPIGEVVFEFISWLEDQRKQT